jgi:CDP-4-dehydro-6-deoxyglucose reductase
MSFRITLQNTSSSFDCESDQSILDAAMAAGVTLSYGCRDGMCGSCKGHVMEGEIDYPEGAPDGITPTEIEHGDALFCKAVPKSDLSIVAQVVQTEVETVVKQLPVKVSAMDQLSEDVVRMYLQLPAMETFDFQAGQWIYVLLKDGRKRAFSLANAPGSDPRDLELHIRHAPGGVFTDFVFDKLEQGALLRIEGPHGTFWYQPDDRPILLVAGGTGFAPLKGIIEQLAQQDDRPPMHLFWGVRTLDDLYMNDLVEQWVNDLGLIFTPVLSEPRDSDQWDGETGFVHEAVIRAYPQMQSQSVYMAGPPQMVEACVKTFTEHGSDPAYQHYDSFEYSSDALQSMKDKSE